MCRVCGLEGSMVMGSVFFRNIVVVLELRFLSLVGKVMVKKGKLIFWRFYSLCYIYLFVFLKICGLLIGI